MYTLRQLPKFSPAIVYPNAILPDTAPRSSLAIFVSRSATRGAIEFRYIQDAAIRLWFLGMRYMS